MRIITCFIVYPCTKAFDSFRFGLNQIKQMLLLLATSLAISLLLAQSPISLGLAILLFALNIAVTLNISLISWFSFLMFLIYIGGILVIFAYFVALQPNQHLLFTPIIYSSITIFFLFSLLPFQTSSIPFLNFSNSLPISFLFSDANTFIYIFLALLLFLTLIAVVKITNLNKGPLRPLTTYVLLFTQTPPLN